MRFTVEPISSVARRAALSLSVALIAGGVALGAAHAQDKAAMLLPGSVNDQSWNAIGLAGLNKLKEMGYETAYSENVSPADQIETMKDYARRGFSPVIGHSGRFLSAGQRVEPNSTRPGSSSLLPRRAPAKTSPGSITTTSTSAT